MKCRSCAAELTQWTGWVKHTNGWRTCKERQCWPERTLFEEAEAMAIYEDSPERVVVPRAKRPRPCAGFGVDASEGG